MSMIRDAYNGFIGYAGEQLKKLRIGRKRKEPERQTDVFPRMQRLGRAGLQKSRPTLKPTPRNLRFFSHTPYARRALNAIKNPIARLKWEVVPCDGIEENSLLKKQASVATNCFKRPNNDDSFATLLKQIIEDMCVGAGAIETQIAGDTERPLWMWPVDGLSIQVYPLWSGEPAEPRYMQTIGYGPVGGIDGVPLRDDELIYIKPHPTTWNPFGHGPLETAFMTISRQLGVAQFAGDLASNAQPTNILWLGKSTTNDQLEAARNWWINDVEGRGKMPIMGGDEDPEVLDLRGGKDEALYLKYQEWLAREIAICFDLSPQNMGVERDVNRSTAEVSEDRDWDQAIIPFAVELEDYFTRKALNERLGFTQLQFRFIGLDREDEEATAEIFDKRYKMNSITPDEIREHYGEEPIKSEWGNLTYADTQLAIAEKRGPNDPDPVTEPDAGKPAAKRKRKEK